MKLFLFAQMLGVGTVKTNKSVLSAVLAVTRLCIFTKNQTLSSSGESNEKEEGTLRKRITRH